MQSSRLILAGNIWIPGTDCRGHTGQNDLSVSKLDCRLDDSVLRAQPDRQVSFPPRLAGPTADSNRNLDLKRLFCVKT